MVSARSRFWLLVLGFVALVSIGIAALDLATLYFFYRYPRPGGQASYVVAGTILSVSACVYAALELFRFMAGRAAILRASLFLIAMAAVSGASLFAVVSHAPYPRHAD